MSDSNRCGQVRKNTNDDLREAVSNFDELRSHYIGTPYEQMFDEVLVSGQNYRQRGTLALPSERRIEQHKLAQELQAHKQRVEKLRSKLAKEHQRAERLRKQNQRLKLELQNIQGSRARRLSKRLDRVRAKVLGKLRI